MRLARALGSLALLPLSRGCTNFIVTKGASADGSVQVTYAADNVQLYGQAVRFGAADHAPSDVVHVTDWDSGRYLGALPQVSHTYAMVGGENSGGINEHQVVIAETTYGGLPHLQHQPKATLDYGTMMQLGLQRGATAREAIDVMTKLVATHGYYSEGESISVADANEAWLLEMIGKGAAELGAVWVAVRIPDGHISGHANQARITTFPRDDPDNCVFSADVVTFARKANLYDGTDADFSFSDVYDPLSFVGVRGGEARVWDFMRRFVDGFGPRRLAPRPRPLAPTWRLSRRRRLSPHACPARRLSPDACPTWQVTTTWPTRAAPTSPGACRSRRSLRAPSRSTTRSGRCAPHSRARPST